MAERYQTKVAIFLVLTRENENGKEILLQERCNTGYMDGKYDTACSGHVEKGESLTMAVCREAKEEIGLTIHEKDLRLVCVIHAYQEDYLNVYFTTDTYQGTPSIMEPNKCDNLQWFPIQQLPSNTISRVRNVITYMGEKAFYDDADFTHHKDL